jgi:hypothetical protein
LENYPPPGSGTICRKELHLTTVNAFKNVIKYYLSGRSNNLVKPPFDSIFVCTKSFRVAIAYDSILNGMVVPYMPPVCVCVRARACVYAKFFANHNTLSIKYS